MKNTLQWRIHGDEFEDGSKIADWKKIESDAWHFRVESSYEMTFDIYEHDGQFWKLYQGRWAVEGIAEYTYRYGGQACRMTQVAYTTKVRSPHSGLLKQRGDLEWVRVYEVNERIHNVMKTGLPDPKYNGKTVAV